MNYFGSGLKFRFKRFAATLVLCHSLVLTSLATFMLDPSFGGGGRVMVSFPDSSSGYSSEALRVFVQPSGRIVVGGVFSNATPDGQLAGVAFVGLTPNGSPDPGFGSGGFVTDWRSDASTSFRDASMYSDGSTLRISQVLRLPVGSSTVRTIRLDPNGVQDNVFVNNVSIGGAPGGFTTSRPTQISVRSDGKILALMTDNGEFFLYRLNADGTRDATFGVNGINPVRFNRIPTPLDVVIKMVVLNDGKILIVGHVPPFNSPNGSAKFFLARLTEAGLPDKTFGGLGFSQVEFGAGLTGFVRRAFFQPDGKILLCGSVSSSDTDVWLARFRPNGRPDTTFGSNGVVIQDFAAGATDVASSIAISPDNKIRIAGWLGSPTNFLVARFLSNGSFEESTTIAFTPNEFTWANDVTLQPDGKLLVVGRTRNPNTTATTGGVFAIARLTE